MELTRCILIVLICSLVGCSNTQHYAPVRSHHRDINTKQQYYVVKKGDTLYSIGFRSGHGYQKLARWNGMFSPYKIEVGQKLRLFKKTHEKKTTLVANKKPEKRRSSSQKVSGSAKKERTSSQKSSTFSGDNKKVLKLIWQWPIKNKILKSYSQTGNKGIDIYGRIGQKVKSASSGKVVYSGSGIKGYGNLLIIKHNYLYLSAYANNSRLLVKEGQVVKKGQVIAEVGRIEGKQTSLHFEIRKNGKPVNPLKYLPKR